MAKANAKTTSAPKATVNIAIPSDFTLEVHGHVISADDLQGMSADAVAYLVGTGWSQSINDSSAMSKESLKGKSEAEVAKIKGDKRAARAAAILSGTVGAVRGTRATPLAVFEREVAEERLTAHLKKMGKAKPKGKVLKAAIQWFLDHQTADIRAEAEARMAAANASVAGLDNVPDFASLVPEETAQAAE